MSTRKTILGLALFFVLLIILGSLFVVTQGQQGILLRLGRLVEDSSTHQARILQPGLHMKTPFIESVRLFDTRLQTLDIKSSRIVTKEKKDVIVDYYVKWRISDLARYFKSTGGNQFKAETLLEQQLNTLLRAQFGKRTISELISDDRNDVMDLLRDNAAAQASGLGVHVVDVRIKGIEFPPTASQAVYERMRADMQKIANRHRANGNAAAEAIRASADAEATVTVAKALADGKALLAKGEAAAARVYADAFGQNKDFFVFYRSLKAYEGSFKNKQDLLVLDQNSAFFNYFKQPLSAANGADKKN